MLALLIHSRNNMRRISLSLFACKSDVDYYTKSKDKSSLAYDLGLLFGQSFPTKKALRESEDGLNFQDKIVKYKILIKG